MSNATLNALAEQGFHLVPNIVYQIVHNTELSVQARLVAIELHINQLNNKDRVSTTKRALSEKLGMTFKTIARSMNELMRKGFFVEEDATISGKMNIQSIPEQMIKEQKQEVEVTSSSQSSTPSPCPLPQGERGIQEEKSSPIDNLRSEDQSAVARRQGESERSLLNISDLSERRGQQRKCDSETASPLPIHLCDGKYTLLGPETQLDQTSLAVLEEVLRRDEPISNPEYMLPHSIWSYHEQLRQTHGDADFSVNQRNTIMLAYWRLKDIRPPATTIDPKILGRHQIRVERVLQGLL